MIQVPVEDRRKSDFIQVRYLASQRQRVETNLLRDLNEGLKGGALQRHAEPPTERGKVHLQAVATGDHGDAR